MTAHFVYDDTWPVPPEVAALTGIERFGGLLHDRVRLQDRALRAARAGLGGATVLSSPTDRAALALTLADAPPDRRYVYLTSDIVEAEPGRLALFLAKLAYARRDLLGRPDGAGPHTLVAVMSGELLRELLRHHGEDRRAWLSDNRHRFDELPAPVLTSIHDIGHFVRFLSGTFYTRAFNAIRTEPRTVIKESADRDKMRREHDYWYQLPPELQRYVVQPYGFEPTPAGARYRMERYVVPDMAILWVHDALTEAEFRAFLDGVFAWFDAVPRRDEDRASALYEAKVDARFERLIATDAGRHLDRVLAATTDTGGLRPLFDRYRALFARDTAPRRSAILHGDLCFSNILYDKRTGLLKFIDPRGASTPDELWGDATYDLAKLSHSVLGGYDFLNHGLFEVVFDDDLRARLQLHEPAGRQPHKDAFVEALVRAGHDPVHIRLREASLFLSMLPLHAESPRKLLGFALNAAAILDEVEAAGRSLGRMLG